MEDAEWDVVYLGGHPRHPVTSAPTSGRLRVSMDALRFMVLGEFYETLFDIPWGAVTGWDVEGANAATRRTSGGRAAAGALLAGIPGAIIGLAATTEEFACALAIDLEDHRVAFLIRDRPPAAVVAAIRAIDDLGDRYQSGSTAVPRVPWEYRTTALAELETCGKEGWEAVGVWLNARGEPQVLLKRISS